jgi:hypothetical protein
MDCPHASTHYPKSLGEFQAWFPTDADCLDYLEWLRWPCGFVCLSCGNQEDGGLGTTGSCVLDAVAAHQ